VPKRRRSHRCRGDGSGHEQALAGPSVGHLGRLGLRMAPVPTTPLRPYAQMQGPRPTFSRPPVTISIRLRPDSMVWAPVWARSRSARICGQLLGYSEERASSFLASRKVSVPLRQMDLGAVAVGTGLVLPLAGAQRAFDEDLRALREEFLDDLAEALAVKITTRCHSVRCLRSPLLRSFQLALVVMLSVTTRPPFCMIRTSGSLPRLPISCARLARHDLVPSFPPQEGRRLRAGVVPSGAA